MLVKGATGIGEGFHGHASLWWLNEVDSIKVLTTVDDALWVPTLSDDCIEASSVRKLDFKWEGMHLQRVDELIVEFL